MGVGAGLYMYVVVVQKFTFAISSPDEFLLFLASVTHARSLPTRKALSWGRTDHFGNIFFLSLWPMTFTVQFGIDKIKRYGHVKYQG